MDETKRVTDDHLHFCNQVIDDTMYSIKEDSYLANRELHTEATKQELLQPTLRHPKSYLFCAKELSSSITTSESTRIISSISIALIVVLSFIDRPLIGVNIVHSKSIVALRPLYMLLVTEVTIVIAYLIVERRRRIEDTEERPRVLNEGGVNWERAVRVLERGLVAHQMIRAVFIDFSVYVVIIVCVLSLL